MQLRSIFLFASLCAVSFGANAADYTLGDLRIDRPVARATAPGQPSSAAYLTIENRGKTADKLLAAESPIAKSVQIHTMKMEGNIMKMREVENLPLPPAATVAMKPGDGYHMMLIGLKQALKPGDQLPLTLTFEKAGKTKVVVKVEDKNAASTMSNEKPHQHMHK